MSPALIELTQQALLLVLRLSLPIVAISMLVGAIVSLFSAATQINDSVLVHLPRLIAVTVALSLLGPWIGSELVAFAAHGFALR